MRINLGPELKLSVARWISIAGHPFVLTLILVIFSARYYLPPGRVLPTIILVLVILVGPLAWYMRTQVKQGKWQNVDASNPEERPAFYIVALCLSAVFVLFLAQSPTDNVLAKGALTIVILLAVAHLLNRWIKLSLHLAFGTFAAVSLFFFEPAVSFLIALFLPALAWSRRAMERHTPREISVGALLGAVAALVLRFA